MFAERMQQRIVRRQHQGIRRGTLGKVITHREGHGCRINRRGNAVLDVAAARDEKTRLSQHRDSAAGLVQHVWNASRPEPVARRTHQNIRHILALLARTRLTLRSKRNAWSEQFHPSKPWAAPDSIGPLSY